MFAWGGGEETAEARASLAWGWRDSPSNPGPPAWLSSDWRPARQGSRTAGVITNRLTARRLKAGPGSGHARHPTTHRRHTVANKPTPRQLSYLRSLAERTGQTFTYPHTFAEAGREIDRLKQVRPESRAERRIERKEIADQLATGPVDSARVREDEISGRGSSATWAHNRHREPEPTLGPAGAQAQHPGRRQAHRAGPLHRRRGRTHRVRPARGWRGQGDRPSRDPGRPRRSYLVERGLQTKDELDALVRDYVAEAERTGAPPLASCPVDRYLDAVA